MEAVFSPQRCLTARSSRWWPTLALQAPISRLTQTTQNLQYHPKITHDQSPTQVTTADGGGMGARMTSMITTMAQSQEDGSMGIIKCAFDPAVQSGQFYGAWMGLYSKRLSEREKHSLTYTHTCTGPPGRGLGGRAELLPIEDEALSNSEETKELLWRESNKATGAHFLE